MWWWVLRAGALGVAYWFWEPQPSSRGDDIELPSDEQR